MRQITALLIATWLILLATHAKAQENAEGVSACGSLKNGYGPYDYLSQRNKLGVVEAFHFTPKVERLMAGESGYLGGDIDYTLRASPNHHRALMSLANWGVKLKGLQPPHTKYSVDCYFDRAFRFRPNDHLPQLIYIDYLGRLGKKAEAIKTAEPLLRAPNLSAFTHNNLGMVMFDLGNYDEALKQYHLAVAAGWERIDLQNRLKSVGRWQPPPPPLSNAASAPESAASAAAP